MMKKAIPIAIFALCLLTLGLSQQTKQYNTSQMTQRMRTEVEIGTRSLDDLDASCTVFTNWNDTDGSVLNLPVAEDGMCVVAVDLEGQAITIDAQPQDLIVNIDAGVAAGESIDSPGSAGDRVKLVATVHSGYISAFADAGGGDVDATSVAHGLSVGDMVTIVGSANYGGVEAVTAVDDANTFAFTAAWSSDDAPASWTHGLWVPLDENGIWQDGDP